MFAEAATRNTESARAMQLRISDGVEIGDYCPSVLDLPEGLTLEEFQSDYGGLGGEGTRAVVEEIRRRLATCEGLH